MMLFRVSSPQLLAPLSVPDTTPTAKVNQTLSEKYFKLRYDEVFRLIKEEEAKFK